MHIKSISLVALLSVCGAWLFVLLHLPVPWMLGPLFTVLISQFFIKVEMYWPVQLRNVGLVVVGASIGQMFLFEIFVKSGWLILFMVVINVALTIASVIMAIGVQKMGNISLKTALTCTVPGGLSQIVIFAEEEKDIDIAVVTYFHVIRVISIVLLIPFILSGHVVQGERSFFAVESIGPLALLLLAAWGSVWFGKKIKLPVAYFLSPVLLVIILEMFSIDTPEIPGLLLHIAQILMGAYIGLLLKPKMLKLGTRVLFLGIGSALLLLAITFGQGLIMSHLLDYSVSTGFLSSAAGGLDQMSLIATAIGADVSVVTVFQIFRMLFVFLFILPLLKYVCVLIDRRNGMKSIGNKSFEVVQRSDGE